MTIPAKQPSTATAADNSSAKIASPTKDQAYLIHVRDMTHSILKEYLPVLYTAPNILYIAMATWGFESSFRMHPGTGNSRHPTRTSPRGSFLGRGYYDSPIIWNLRKGSFDPVLQNNIEDGLYPHGISGFMGGYAVRGTPVFSEIFARNTKIVSDLGLAVNPGESIRDIFPDNDVGLIRNIACGLLVYDAKYKAYIKTSDPFIAIRKSVASYVGNAGIADANGFRPEQRVDQLDGKRTSSFDKTLLSRLSEIGLTPNNPKSATALGSVALKPKALVESSGSTPNTPSRVATAGTEASAQKSTGCT